MVNKYIYPISRAHSGNCKMCNRPSAQMQKTGFIEVQDTEGNLTRLMKLTCPRCGFTIFFDYEAAKKFPYDGKADEEVFPA